MRQLIMFMSWRTSLADQVAAIAFEKQQPANQPVLTATTVTRMNKAMTACSQFPSGTRIDGKGNEASK
jgi:hypothetical protein